MKTSLFEIFNQVNKLKIDTDKIIFIEVAHIIRVQPSHLAM